MTPRRRTFSFLEFTTGFFNAATILPLLVVLPAMLIKSKHAVQMRGQRMSFPAHFLGLCSGLPFAAAFVYFIVSVTRSAVESES